MKKFFKGAILTSAVIFSAAGAGWADSAGGEGGGLAGSMLPMLGYLLFFGVIMYLLVYLPQKRKDKKAKELMNSLQVGYRVTTHSGIVGRIINIKDDVLTVESGVERTRLDIKKWAVRDVEKPVEA